MTTRPFRESLAALPASVQRQARRAYRLFQQNPSHPNLQLKSISPRDPTVYSARVGRGYRVVGYREDDAMVWVWIGSHAEYDRVIGRL